MKLCSKCNKNIAVVFTSTVENGKPAMEGLCIECAKKSGMPIIDQLMQQTGMNEEDIENLTGQMNSVIEGMDLEDLDESSMFSKMMNSAMPKNEEDNEEVDIEEDFDTQTDKKNKKKKHKDKHLRQYGTNLTEKARNNEVDRIIGRNREIDRAIQILNRRNKNNPILIGEPGVGKTAIAEGLAVRIVQKEVPAKLFDAQIYLLDLTAVIAGTQFRGQFEGRMKNIIKEAKENENVILVIDEIHNIMGAGEVQGGAMNAANILKPSLAKGEIQLIGAYNS